MNDNNTEHVFTNSYKIRTILFRGVLISNLYFFVIMNVIGVVNSPRSSSFPKASPRYPL